MTPPDDDAALSGLVKLRLLVSDSTLGVMLGRRALAAALVMSRQVLVVIVSVCSDTALVTVDLTVRVCAVVTLVIVRDGALTPGVP